MVDKNQIDFALVYEAIQDAKDNAFASRKTAEEHSFEIVSYGCGVNSTSLICGLIERGERPNAILMSDTGGEKPETYAYLESFQQFLKSKDFPEVTVVRQKITLEQDCLDRETLPSKAFGFGSCSDRFKIQPQKRWIRENNITNAIWYVGIHAGESRRAKKTLSMRSDVRFPLIEWGWGQQECLEAIKRAGLGVPLKSACFFCPSMKKHEVLQLSKNNPDLFERAIEMERAAKEAGTLQTVRGLGRNWSWEALSKADESQLRLPMFDDHQAPICDTCIDWDGE